MIVDFQAKLQQFQTKFEHVLNKLQCCDKYMIHILKLISTRSILISVFYKIEYKKFMPVTTGTVN